ncbi:LysE family transporter [Phyllobacterium sp. 628]|uniref:LysE family translocator n=1 Tax=Phyllobacterium sp. 628 TaxID=2718938 RepID=UPI001662413B|nr:LysE family transporter [Phyllobacterium sp. 628]QND51457.1 LysE family transporter [Phyllobacterium sp. 628]
MSAVAVFFTILGVLLLGAMSPGPSFVLVSRIAITSPRLHGLAAALGMGIGGTIFACLAVLGLTALLMQVEWLYLLLKLAGGAYLIYVGISIWRGAAEPLTLAKTGAHMSLTRSFSFALVTQLSNPKTAIVYGSLFAALLPANPPLWLLLALPPMVFIIEAGWYSFVATMFSTPRARATYAGFKAWIDRGAGAVMGALGAKLMFEAVKSHRI